MLWPLIIVGVVLIILGTTAKRGITEDEQHELEMRRRRRQGVISDFNRPLSEREVTVAADALVFLLSPRGLIIAGVVLVIVGIL
jgi:hypothetical protein